MARLYRDYIAPHTDEMTMDVMAMLLIFFTASEHLRIRRKMDIQSIEITDEDGALLASVTIQDALRREDEP